jgi:hypothetical protein
MQQQMQQQMQQMQHMEYGMQQMRAAYGGALGGANAPPPQ